MTLKGKYAITLTLIALLGCRESAGTAAAASFGNTAGGVSGGGTRVESIPDPSFNNMRAFEVTVPGNWHFQGVLFQGGACDGMPSPVFRASSPDGLSFIERLPPMGWAWGTGPMGGKNHGNCLPLEKAMGAQEFLHYLAGTMKVDYVSDAPLPEGDKEAIAESAKSLDSKPNPGPMQGISSTNTAEGAAAIVRFNNGTFTMKGLMQTRVDCRHSHIPGHKPMFAHDPGLADSESYQWTATVRYTVAPEAKFDSVKNISEHQGIGAKPEPQWLQAYFQRQQQQASQMLNAAAERSRTQLQAQHDSFEQSQAVQQHMHEQFLATMQRGTDMSMAATQRNMNARSTATSDWVDYALDQRTVVDPGTGQVSKVSSAYNYTWVDSTGKVSYQTNDPNANPNGVLQGNWTKQAIVHGDGSQ
jgi:hypothetical protein